MRINPAFMPFLFGLSISPAWASAPWAAELQAGDCRAVLARLPNPATDVERLVVGRCALRTGDAVRASAALGAVSGGLAAAARGELARAQLGSGDGAAALTTLKGYDLAGDAELILTARALLLGGKPEEATLTLGPPPSDASDERLYWTGQASAVSAVRLSREAAISAWQTLWTRYPTSAWAEQGGLGLAVLGAAVPDYRTDAGRALAFTRAKKLLAIQQAPLAMPLLEGIDTAVPFEGGAVMFMAQSYFDAKQYPKAVVWFKRAGASAAGPASAFNEALATARSGDYPAAAERYAALILRWPTSPQADEAAWKPGYMEYDAGHLESAIGLMAAYINAHPGGKFLWDARWLRAWSFYRLGRFDEAVVAFDKVIGGSSSGAGELAVAARYWKARTLVSPTEQAAGLAAVIAASPDSSYAYFAAARLGRTWPPRETAEPPAFPAEFLAAHTAVRDARLLADAGLGELAVVSSSAIKAAAASEVSALAMAGLLMDTERFQAAQRLASPYCGTPAGRALCAPRPYRAIVDGISARTGLDSLLPYAIMNAESGLDPTVTSPAGARGLMQLMPALAAELAQDRVPGFVVDDLYRAGVNTRLGATELSLLHNAFAPNPLPAGGSLPMVIAGYNGGKAAVTRWLGTYAEVPDADRYSEDISFTETRRYVRRVLGYYQKYRRIYGG
ncbi:MAG: tetratricopeptide repeat protein [Myxococcales bacterium]|nr:tetratricopeptide repeat protein [Myxococcales bacterium]